MRFFDGHLTVLIGLIITLMTAGAIVSDGNYLSLFNLQSMAGQVPEIGLLAIGVLLAMCVGNGGIELSGIALANLSGVVAATIAVSFFSASQDPEIFSLIFIVVALATGFLGGLLNGLLIAYLKITAILCTLGTQMLFIGLAVAISDGRSVRVGAPGPLYEIGNGLLFEIPISFLLFIGVACIIGFVLRYTPFGMWLMLNGSNPKAAEYAGFPKNKVIISTYTVSGILSSLAGIIIAARTINVKWDYGTSYLLVAILIAVMAGVKPEGGYGRVICVVLSAITLQMMSSMLNFMGLSNFIRDFAWGALLLGFLAIGRFRLLDLINLQKHAISASVRSPHAQK
ncbi:MULTISPECIES: ABC transporter permease [Thalassospira]|uniref:ABC transporter permease n=1 Tax=Thalassospira indica TaxID=1891279 RepID=A0ABM6Y3L7_9PROT|nr:MULTISPECIES: ABC transporter permease [Thalassospira]OAZ13916.1 sugar ABC transporter permease [Thalassospira profundimaris]BDW94781.1 sugar ABC transporter permease [Thalassospira tepidiphila]AXO16153.1 ABC transporter permease [Thalassospira indica]EKF08816.1 inner-membrane translocator [Thalassospira profundimaris WP0211]WOI13042.1 ABC transporter permease [Thalassospira lucentensis]